ncbi:hypothetical protein [Micromonospora radicis]|uniref:hypothetical protein n=1 Tax=Micromonospora radicis TaxID=1894971 RepID=UPI0018F31370|nr:hypothetical protein [Micromonospora radicis]
MSVQLLGGEMRGWSDLDGRHGPGPVRGPVVTALLAAVPDRPDLPGGGRTLVIGPHAPDLVDVLHPAEVTVLVRGLPDAEALAARYADRSGVRVCCGSPEQLAGLPAYDTVVALDGPTRLSSVEGRELTWGETVDLLVSVLRPGGRLLLGVENLLGTHRLLALPPEHTDSDWATLGEYDDTRPAGLDRLRQRLIRAGLRLVGTWAAFPTPLAPVALFSPELLADPTIVGFLQATAAGQPVADVPAGTEDREPAVPTVPPSIDPGRLVGADQRGPVPTVQVLADPGRLIGAAIRNGAATALAAGWVLLAERVEPVHPPDPDRSVSDRSVSDRSGSDRSGSDRSGSDRSVSDRSVSDRSGSGRSGSDRSGSDRSGVGRSGVGRSGRGGFEVGRLHGVPIRGDLPAGVLRHAGQVRQVHRDPGGGWRLADGEAVPPGRTVEDLVVAGTLRRDLPAVRAWLTSWQAGACAGVPADQVVVTPAGTWHALAVAADPMQALRRLATRLAEAGLAELWPTGTLTDTLFTMSGRMPNGDGGRADTRRVPNGGGGRADTGWVSDGDGGRAGAGRARTTPDEYARGDGVRGWRELLVDRDRLAREVAEARARQEWYERTLTEREDELRRLRRIVSLLSGTPTARAGRLLLASARSARAALRHLRTPD